MSLCYDTIDGNVSLCRYEQQEYLYFHKCPWYLLAGNILSIFLLKNKRLVPSPLLAAGNWQHEGNFYAIIASEKWLFTVNKTLGTLLPPPPDSQCLKLHFIFRLSLLSFTIYIWTLLLVLMMSRWDQRKGDILSKHNIFCVQFFKMIFPNIDNDCFKSLGIFGVVFNYPHFRLVCRGQLFLKDSYSHWCFCLLNLHLCIVPRTSR